MNYRKSEAKEVARAQFRGVWAAITTPFTPEDRLDEAGLRRNMRDYTEAALAGRFAEAEQISKQLDPVRPVHEKWMRDPWHRNEIIPIQYLKAWTELLGMAGGHVRAPLDPVIRDS
jgi:dihydrodipicolinate synthase/N-acetylneuraminate lyase